MYFIIEYARLKFDSLFNFSFQDHNFVQNRMNLERRLIVIPARVINKEVHHYVMSPPVLAVVSSRCVFLNYLLLYTFFYIRNYNFAKASIFLTFPEIEPEIFLNLS